MAQIAVAWSLAKVTAPIVGTTSLNNLKEMIGMCDLSCIRSPLISCRRYQDRVDGGGFEVSGGAI